MGKILVVDDEVDICRIMSMIFSQQGHDVSVANNTSSALSVIDDKRPDIAFIDMKLGSENGLDLLKEAKSQAPEMTVIMISAFGTVESAVKSMKTGAYDYICKPFINDEIELLVERVFQHRGLVESNEKLQRELTDTLRFDNFIGASAVMRRTKSLMRKVLPSSANVLISGETGAGKSLAAHIIHHHGPRKSKPFVTINCGSIPESLIESELFGHKKGAFTGAVENKIGLLVKADQGTVFLDEVGELPLNMQVKLLGFIQTKELMPVGSTEPKEVDVRIIAATNRDLSEEVAGARFREDLYYRLKVLEIRMPPLRELKQDIPQLVSSNLIKFARKNDKAPSSISSDAMSKLMDHLWPGNIRELENTIERAVLLSEGPNIELDDIWFDEPVGNGEETEGDEPTDLKSRVALLEREYILEALKKNGFNKEETARYLNVNLSTLYRKLGKSEPKT
jgi:DNA-binding NtrC family response regulator